MAKEKEPCINTALYHKMYVGHFGGDEAYRDEPTYNKTLRNSAFTAFVALSQTKELFIFSALAKSIRVDTHSTALHIFLCARLVSRFDDVKLIKSEILYKIHLITPTIAIDKIYGVNAGKDASRVFAKLFQKVSIITAESISIM